MTKWSAVFGGRALRENALQVSDFIEIEKLEVWR
jgi:hypothetical protein